MPFRVESLKHAHTLTNMQWWSWFATKCRFKDTAQVKKRGGGRATLRSGSVVRTSVCSWRTFPGLRLICGWHVTISWVKCPLHYSRKRTHIRKPQLVRMKVESHLVRLLSVHTTVADKATVVWMPVLSTATVARQATFFSHCMVHHPGQLSLPSLQGR